MTPSPATPPTRAPGEACEESARFAAEWTIWRVLGVARCELARRQEEVERG